MYHISDISVCKVLRRVVACCGCKVCQTSPPQPRDTSFEDQRLYLETMCVPADGWGHFPQPGN